MMRRAHIELDAIRRAVELEAIALLCWLLGAVEGSERAPDAADVVEGLDDVAAPLLAPIRRAAAECAIRRPHP